MNCLFIFFYKGPLRRLIGIFFLFVIGPFTSCSIQQHSGNPHVIKRPVISSESARVTVQKEYGSGIPAMEPPESEMVADSAYILLKGDADLIYTVDTGQAIDELDQMSEVNAIENETRDSLFESLTREQQNNARLANSSFRMSLTADLLLFLGLLLSATGIGGFLILFGCILGLIAFFPGVVALGRIGRDPELIRYKKKAVVATAGGVVVLLILVLIILAVIAVVKIFPSIIWFSLLGA